MQSQHDRIQQSVISFLPDRCQSRCFNLSIILQVPQKRSYPLDARVIGNFGVGNTSVTYNVVNDLIRDRKRIQHMLRTSY